MTGRASHFIWYELLTSDVDAAAAFYGAVLGWKARPSGTPGMDYRLLSIGGADVCGLMALPENAAAGGMRPAWLGYLDVADVDAAVARISGAGGSLHMPASDIPGVGRLAMVADPQGAGFYVMTPMGEGASSSFAPGKPGHGGWHELHTSDWRAALAFYREQFGWTVAEEMDMGPRGTYLVFETGGGGRSGGMVDDPDAPRPYWLYYFCVDEIDAAKKRVEVHGGQALMEPHEVPGGGWIVQARDPQGALFAVVGPRKS